MLKGIRIGLGLTGSFCTFEKIFPQMEKMINEGAEIIPIMTNSVSTTDTRFGAAEDFKQRIKSITGNEIIDTMVGAEPIGPKSLIDVMVIAPCTGNNL